MKNILRYGLILGLICLISGGLLAGVHSFTQEKILQRDQLGEQGSLEEVFPSAKNFQPVKSEKGEIAFYKAYGDKNDLLGACFKAEGKGYSSIIVTMAGVDLSGKITAIKVLNLNETPGLGSRVAEKEFTNRFNGKFARQLADVQAITGATISSHAVINAVQLKAEEVLKLLKNEK